MIEGCQEDEGGRVWKTKLQPASDIIAAGKELRSQTKALTERAVRDEQSKKVWNWLSSHPNGATKSRIRDETGINGKRLVEVIDTLLESGNIESCQVVVSNGRKCAGYKAIRESTDKGEQQGNLFS